LSRRAPRLSTRRPPPRPPFPAASSKAAVPNGPRRLPSPSARSAPRPFRNAGPRSPPPLSERWTSNHEPATGARALPPVTRLPTLLHRPAPKRGTARPRPLPGALHARALLGHAPLVDFCNRNDLQARPSDLETRPAWRPLDFRRAPLLRAGPRLDGAIRRLPDDDSTDAEPRIHGSGAVWFRDAIHWMVSPASSAAMARCGGFTPTRSARTPHVAPPESTTIGAP
jgi:hypothetical protein